MLHALDCSSCPDCACSRLCEMGPSIVLHSVTVYIGTQEGFLVSSLLCIKFYLLVCLLLVPELVVSMEPIISHSWSASLHAQNQDLFSLSASPHSFKNLSFMCQIIVLSCNSPWLTLVFTSLKTTYHEETLSHSPLF